MSHVVYVAPKGNKTERAKAGRYLRQNFVKLDKILRKTHDQNFEYDGEKMEHGLTLHDGDDTQVFASADAHWSYDHLLVTRRDVRRAVKEVFGSTKEYKITISY